MSRRKSKGQDYQTPAEKELANFKLPDLKRQVIMRGYPFLAIGGSSVLDLQQYFLTHYYEPKNPKLLDEYDDYIEKIGKERGWDKSLYHPDLRLGYIAERDDEGNVIKRKRIKIKIKKKKRDRTNDGLYSGTKKAYTYELVKKGLDRKEIIKLVIEQFPEAKEKSIIIWMNRAKRKNQ